MKVRAEAPTVENCTNFNVVKDSKTAVGTTLENLKAAIAGETGASAKYTGFAQAAKSKGSNKLLVFSKLLLLQSKYILDSSTPLFLRKIPTTSNQLLKYPKGISAISTL